MNWKAYWKEGLVLLLVIIISVLLVRRFTSGDTLAEYEEKRGASGTSTSSVTANSGDKGAVLLSPEHSSDATETTAAGDSRTVPLSPTEGETDTSVTDAATTATTGTFAADAAVNRNTSTGENGGDTMTNRPNESSGFYYSEIPDDVFARMQGKSFPDDCSIPRDDLRYVTVQYIDFNGVSQQGELVCNKAISQDLAEIFLELYEASYPIQSIRLIDDYNADDDISVAANNTSCFCYRVVDGTTRLSNHAKGLAIDVNPLYNPYVKFLSDGTPYTKLPVCAPYIDRSDAVVNPYRIDTNDLCYQAFRRHGFSWGGAWRNSKDYQHFEK